MGDNPKGISRRRFFELGAAGAAVLSTRQANADGALRPDTSGPPLGVARMDPGRSYAGMPQLLQKHLASGDPDAWMEIARRIDYTYRHLTPAMAALDAESGFGKQVTARLERGQRLLFKPNLVVTACIDPISKGESVGSKTCTEWAFMAALMRWFHDDLGVGYHKMTIGEAATCMPLFAGMGTMFNPAGQPVTTEGVIEGKTGDFYFGWGFYFARKYLSERLPGGATDDPMLGHAESVSGTYIPPGLAGERLMVYDLNRISDNPEKGRDVAVPDGVNYRSITLHKAIVGGDPTDPEDRKAYPGAVLVNVPKFKIHAISLLTNAIKNLGIGLYPMESAKGGDSNWDYASPPGPVPAMKEPIPHQVWVPEMDRATALAKRDTEGRYLVRKTGGLPATMIDIVKATANQDVMMLHVVDGIETINLSHTGDGDRIPEGLAVAGLDPVATDLFCARYLFSNVSLDEALDAALEDGAGGHFPQRVPVAEVVGSTIVTGSGYDCPLARDRTLARAEQRGLGRRSYHIVGRDATSGRRLVSVQGHLGTLDDAGAFADVYTTTLYFATSKMPWDLQRTAFSYMEASDQLTKTSWRRRFLETFDENGDGIVDYEEFGRSGMWHTGMYMGACSGAATARDPMATLAINFSTSAMLLRNGRKDWNVEGHDIYGERVFSRACLTGFRMSRSDVEMPDADHPESTCGKGEWPTIERALQEDLRNDLGGLYAAAFAYADAKLNKSAMAGPGLVVDYGAAITRYVQAVQSGETRPLDFTLAIPKGLSKMLDGPLPNVEETDDRARMFTLRLAGDQEVLPGPAPFAMPTDATTKKT